MSDERPRPKYGEYADVPPKIDYPPPTLPAATPPATSPQPAKSSQPQPPEPAGATPERPRYNTRDLIITTALLLIGVWDVASQWSVFADFGPRLNEAYQIQNLGEFTSYELAITVGLWINVARAVVLVVTIVISLVLISRGRRAFWVPLAGGVLALLVVIFLTAYVVASDPAFMAFVERSNVGG